MLHITHVNAYRRVPHSNLHLALELQRSLRVSKSEAQNPIEKFRKRINDAARAGPKGEYESVLHFRLWDC